MKSTINKYLRFASLGFEILGSILVPVGAGYWADKHFETKPWLTLIGSLLGVMAVMVRILTVVKTLQEEENKEDKSKDG